MANQRRITDAERAEFLARITSGETVSAACEAIGISRSSPYRIRDRDERFAADWDFAERLSIELLGDLVAKTAMKPEVVERYDAEGKMTERVVKPPNLMHAIRVLERRHPHWKPTAEPSNDKRQVNVGCASIVNGKLCFGRTGDND